LKKPDLKINIIQESNNDEEAEQIALFEMKKKYLTTAYPDSSTSNDSLKIMVISLRDSSFIQYVNQQSANTNQLLSIQGHNLLSGKQCSTVLTNGPMRMGI